MNPIQPHLMSSLWNESEWTHFAASIDLRWITSSATPLEKGRIVIDLLRWQEEEILSFPQGQEIVQRFPANPNNPFFYWQRERWLAAYNKIQFWRQLPGGADYLKGQGGCEQALAYRLREWMLSSPEVLSLKRLQIFSKHAMTRLPPEIGLCKQLTDFMMTNTLLQELPPEFGELVNLERVFLWNNRLRHLCPEFQRLQHLERLELNNNLLQDIDPVGFLRNLETLSVCKNQIRRLPPQLQWDRLDVLALDENQLTELPDNLYEVTSLTLLYVCQNRLSSIPEKISQLSKLDSLFLHRNQVTSLPSSLGTMPNLRCISMTHNLVTEIPRNLGEAPQLIEITFEGNPLKQRPAFLPQRIWTDVT